VAKVPTIDRREILAQNPLLRSLDREHVEALAARTRTVTHRANEVIFLKGDPGSGLIAVIGGRVKISVTSAEGRELILNIIDPGEFFGEIALLDGKDRTADAIAMTDCSLLVLDRRDFLPLVEHYPDMALKLIAVLCERLRHTSEHMEDVLFLEVPARLARRLLVLAHDHGEPTSQGVRIDFRLSQQEIGNMIGISRESINKQFSEWRKSGLISVENSFITLKNESQLRRIAGDL